MLALVCSSFNPAKQGIVNCSFLFWFALVWCNKLPRYGTFDFLVGSFTVVLGNNGASSRFLVMILLARSEVTGATAYMNCSADKDGHITTVDLPAPRRHATVTRPE